MNMIMPRNVKTSPGPVPYAFSQRAQLVVGHLDLALARSEKLTTQPARRTTLRDRARKVYLALSAAQRKQSVIKMASVVQHRNIKIWPKIVPKIQQSCSQNLPPTESLSMIGWSGEKC